MYPQDIAEFVLIKSVIYFSFGSVINSKTLPRKYRDILLAVFKRLPYSILWQYDLPLENVPSNVLIKKWFPQQDILGLFNKLYSYIIYNVYYII